jgi:signal transduction histidine kinase
MRYTEQAFRGVQEIWFLRHSLDKMGFAVLSSDHSKPMKVILISADDHLYALCREILNDFAGYDWHLSMADPANCPANADLYIWDGFSKIDLPRELDGRMSRHLFLVHRNDAPKFCHDSGSPEETILLKPVTRASLSAFLGFAASASQERISMANSLRADRDEILQCLIQANLKLQEYDQDRTNFLARAVHDFRTPLTATSGYCGLLLGEALGPLSADQKDVLRRMQHSVKRLSRMASAMFELSVGRQVKKQPELRETDIAQCVEQALHEVNPFVDSKQINVSVDLDPVPGTLYVESGQIEQVLINILDNACKFTPRSGEIEIRGYPFFWERRSRRSDTPLLERRSKDCRLPNTYRVDICDSGQRILREHLDTIFEEYTTYHGGQNRSGGGLGLAICKMIIRAHDGRVWAENTDHGPRFSFVIPVQAAEQARGPKIAAGDYSGGAVKLDANREERAHHSGGGR